MASQTPKPSRSSGKTAPNAGDPGEDLARIARAAADKLPRPNEPLSRSAALASAPWLPSMPPAWEREFRKAYADRLEELGAALPAKPSSSARGSGGVTTLERRLLSQSSQEFRDQDAKAKAVGLSWSTWARRKLAT